MQKKKPIISIITAVRNQLAMNELFLESLQRYTKISYELIIIDNNSTDGSRELFEKFGATVIHNEQNYSYPYCQNQGIRVAEGDFLAFFNNDIILSPEWDTRLLEVIGKNGCEVVSFATNDRCPSGEETKKYNRRWKRIKYPLLLCGGSSRFWLRLMFRLMYCNYEKTSQRFYEKYKYEMRLGFSGPAIIFSRLGLEKAGLWDERLQCADFDLYARLRKRHAEIGDIQPLSIISGIYIHHYGRLSSKAGRKQILFADSTNLISLDDKWGEGFGDMISKEIRQ
ncbi:glycosyl transferase [Bacteroidia bacterium]|nr:glycosyl transferase [Bacteroidia bacterium]